jgi:hypothetical protein
MGYQDRENSGLDTKRKHRCIYLCLVKRALHIRIAIQYNTVQRLYPPSSSSLMYAKKVQRNLP